MEEQQLQRNPPPCDPEEELQRMPLVPPRLMSNKRLSKQLSMSDALRDVAWEKRRRQILRQLSRKNAVTDSEDITDDDLNELKGCIELGFGFNEEEGHSLCNTLPALDLYFAVSRQISSSPVSTPRSHHSVTSFGAPSSSSFDSPKSDSDSWKICSPGDDPQQVKTKLRHWAQAWHAQSCNHCEELGLDWSCTERTKVIPDFFFRNADEEGLALVFVQLSCHLPFFFLFSKFCVLIFFEIFLRKARWVTSKSKKL